jgi:hypothetical protein
MELGKWDVEVSGQVYAVSVDRSENGKDAIRINGRVAAKPIGAEEAERSLTVAGWPYVLKRIGANKYELEVDESPVAVEHARARTRETGHQVLAHSDAPVTLKKSELWDWLPKLGYVAIVLGVAGLMWMLNGPGYKKVAHDRVQRVFSEMHDMKGSPFAVTFWFKNKKMLELNELNAASDQFTKWSMAKDMYRKIGDFEVLDVAEVKDASEPTAIVHVKVEGNTYALKVVKDKPIEWAE